MSAVEYISCGNQDMKHVGSWENRFAMRALVFLCSVLFTQGVRGWTTEQTDHTTADEGWPTEQMSHASSEVSCGGYLYNMNDTFHSPNYPNEYPNNVGCTWYIRPGYKFIRLEFFDLNTECGYDYVDVYDGYDTSSRRVLRLCRTNHTVYHSTGNYLTVHFRSDVSVTRPGFRATYKVVAESSCLYNCGYQPGSCSCRSDCGYRGTCCGDYTAYCGNTTEQPSTTAEPEWSTPTSLTTQHSCQYNCGNHLGSCSCYQSCQYFGNCCYDFHSYCGYNPTTSQPSCRYNCGSHFGSCSCDSSCQRNGNCCHDFHSYCESTTHSPSPVSCGGYLYNMNDTFHSPNYPNEYPNNVGCIWYIRPGYKFIRLEFFDLNTECGYDYVDVYDGYDTSSRRVLRLCRTNHTVYHSTGNYLTVRFSSDASVTRPGFRATYKVVGTAQPSCRYNCGRHLGSCSCYNSCQRNGDCCHDFYSYCGSTTDVPTTAQPSCRYNCGRHLGSCSCYNSCQWNGDCCHDFYSYCSVETTPSGSCGDSLFGSGTFTSPNHPGYYNDNSYCVWQLRAAYDQRIFLAFSYMQLENCCSCDYISLYDGPSVHSSYLGKVCNNSLSTFYSTSNYMTVLFRTDSSVVGRGFSAEFVSTLKPSSGRVGCSSDNMNIVINRAYLNSLGYDAHSLYLDDPYCRPQISSYEVVFSFPLNTCGNVRKFDNGRIVYTNHIRGWPSTHGEITRQSHLKMNVTCQMEPDSVSQILFVVENGGNSSITGSGRYNTSMAFYKTGSFYEKVTDVPYKVVLNQDLYVQVDLRSSDSSLILFLDTCVASPSPFEFDTRPYYLVRNGCGVDNTYRPISSGTQSRARFSFRAFQFLRGTDSVYLQCKVLICPASDSNSRCRRGCSRRVARELKSEHESQTLVVGPIQLKDSEKEKEGPEK
ncbi:deleted in malignant brain tumors 1 protein isoform X4 [Girardinichthys multiradiatus]|uniref:deleted in malignant brain tumors 1 protein isoform X4 n=1 Tax=Girardinichthys multiradiatus TaxID=208333 RepID=UPI001FAD4361|nr:deleted in malignant brain tumors 1 protein isoform X4 [Girardinichthys multiradiatus]